MTVLFFLMIRRPPRSTPLYSSAASDVYKRQEWLKSRDNQERVSISITREETLYDLNQWLRKQLEFGNKKGGIFWNVIGPEGGWSSREIDFFNKNNNTFVKLSDTILRTSTASINASSILNQWRNDLKLRN